MNGVELYIERLKAEGKITQEEINKSVEELRVAKPPQPSVEDLESLKNRQDEAENTILFILDLTLGGM